MKRLELSVFLGVIFCIVVSFLSFEGECADIRKNVLRLHILANSDSYEDQQLKLMVRDSIIDCSEIIFAGCQSYDEAKSAALDNLHIFEAAARRTLAENNCSYDVSVSLADSYFSTRTYGDITLPAGIYEAIKIEIGQAQGQNWWCVMFPSVCLPAASGELPLDCALSDEQISIVCADGYELKFRCVEIYEEFIEELRRNRDE